MMSFALDPVFASRWFLLLLSILVIAVPWLVPVAGRTVTPSQRKKLQWLRTGTALLLLLAILRPSLVRTASMPTEATIAVLLDRSRSMSLPADADQTRSAIQNDIVKLLRPAISSLDESLTLKLMEYAGETKELGTDDATISTLDELPKGNATDISRAISAAVESAAGRPLAGVVLIGDGVEVLPVKEQDKKTLRDPQSAARLLASLEIPLWSVAIGPPGDLDQVRDVEVAELGESFSLFAGNESNVDFSVRTRAMTGRSFTVRLTMVPEQGGAPVEVASRNITPTVTSEAIPLSIPIIAPAAGNFLLTVQVEPQEGETLLSNNSQVAFVDIREGGGRVLYLEGQPRQEQRFILQSLRRFPDLQVNYRWIASDQRDRWPVDLGLANPSSRFDVILIGDLPADAIGKAQLTTIAKLVGDGASLLMIGGLETFAKGGYGVSPLADALPVNMTKILPDLTGEVRPVIAENHPIIALNPAGSQKSQTDKWNALPPFLGANRFADIRVAPGIEVLLETAEGDPLLVIGEYGSGRVAALGVDSTYRWWRYGKNLEHRRFWRQLLLWLLNRDVDLADAIDIRLSQRRVEMAQSIDYAITYPKTSSSDAKTVELSIISEDGSRTVMKPDLVTSEEELGVQEGKLSGLSPGMYRMRAEFTGVAASIVEKPFQILDQAAELRQPYADHTYLSQLAAQTAAAGGAMFLPDETNQLINLIQQLRRKSEAPVVQKYRLGDSALSAWPLFILLVGLLSGEWYLRRRWGLA
jgi:uncharacterized membrane protein